MKIKKFQVLFAYLLVQATFTSAQGWSSLSNGVDGIVWSINNFNNSLIVSGGFTNADMLQVNGISSWDGINWGDLGSGTDNDGVRATEVYLNELYVTGPFIQAGGIVTGNVARWDGNNWDSVGTPAFNFDYPTCFCVFNGELYMGGSFNTVGNISVRNIAKWNGTSWDSLGSGTNGDVWCMVVYNGYLYVGGSFSSAGGISINSLARWDGNQWSSFSSGVNGYVRSMATFNNNLYIGGSFSLINGVPANNIAKWDGFQFYSLGLGINSPSSDVYSICSNQNSIFVGGHFTMAGGQSASSLAAFNGLNWVNFGDVLNDSVIGYITTLYFDQLENKLYVGGSFNKVGNINANNIAKYDLTLGVGNDDISNYYINHNYPSIVRDNLIINHSSSFTSKKSLIIYDNAGRIIHNEVISDNSSNIDFNKFNEGMYYLAILSDKELLYLHKIVHIK